MKYEPTGVYLQPDELERLKSEQAASGMWDSQGVPFGDPQRLVDHFIRKYKVHFLSAIDIRDGQFWQQADVPDPRPPAPDTHLEVLPCA